MSALHQQPSGSGERFHGRKAFAICAPEPESARPGRRQATGVPGWAYPDATDLAGAAAHEDGRTPSGSWVASPDPANAPCWRTDAAVPLPRRRKDSFGRCFAPVDYRASSFLHEQSGNVVYGKISKRQSRATRARLSRVSRPCLSFRAFVSFGRFLPVSSPLAICRNSAMPPAGNAFVSCFPAVAGAGGRATGVGGAAQRPAET